MSVSSFGKAHRSELRGKKEINSRVAFQARFVELEWKSPGVRFVSVKCTLNFGRAHRSVSLGVSGESPDARLLMCAARSYAHSSQRLSFEWRCG